MRDSQADPEWIKAIRAELNGPLIVNAPAGAPPKGGFRLMRGAELAIVDLDDPDAMRSALHPKWRNQLNKAEASPLNVINQPLDPQNHAWFFELEQSQQRARGYRAYPSAFLYAFAAANPGDARLYTAMLGTEPAAAMLVLRHGQMATYQAGVTTEAGRTYCAHNLLLWRIMTDLQHQGLRQLDLGRADLSAGLRRFKAGTGARIETLPGTYLFHAWLPGTRRRTASRRPSRDAAPGIAP